MPLDPPRKRDVMLPFSHESRLDRAIVERVFARMHNNQIKKGKITSATPVHVTLTRLLLDFSPRRVLGAEVTGITPHSLFAYGPVTDAKHAKYPVMIPSKQTYAFYELARTSASSEDLSPFLFVMDWLNEYGYIVPEMAWRDVKSHFDGLCDIKNRQIYALKYFKTYPDQLTLFLPTITESQKMEIWDGGGLWSAPEDNFKYEVRALYNRAREESGVKRIATLVEACKLQQDFTPLDMMIGEIDKQGDDIVAELPQTVGGAFDIMGQSFMETREMANAIRGGSYAYPLVTPEPKGLVQKALALFGRTPDKVSSKPERLSPTEQYERTTKILREGIDQFNEAKNVLRRHNERGRQQAKAFEMLSLDIQDYLNDPEHAELLDNDRMLAKELRHHSESLAENANLMYLCAQTSEHTGERVTDVGHELNKTLKVVNVAMTIHTAGRLPDAEATARSLQGAQVKMLKAANDIMTDLVMVADLTKDADPSRTQARLEQGQTLRAELKKLITADAAQTTPSAITSLPK